MKNPIQLVTLAFFISIFSTFATAKVGMFNFPATKLNHKLKNKPVLLNLQPKPKILIVNSINQTNLFLNAIGRRESSNRYNITNRWGYMGKYQFGRKTLNNLGYKNISNKQFLNNPKIQEEAMIKLLKHNKHILRKEIKKYSGTSVHGVYITESGLLAAAHLAGPGNVKKWLRRGKRFRDGLGTDLVEYLKLFGDYRIII